MEETHANAVVAEDLINQMLADGIMYANDDGSFQITGPDGQPKSYKPNNNEWSATIVHPWRQQYLRYLEIELSVDQSRYQPLSLN